MNSLLNHSRKRKTSTPENFLVTFERNLLQSDIDEVEQLMQKLQFLGVHFDPFLDDAQSECYQIIEQLGLKEHLNNPYLATNILLRLLDLTEQRLNNLKQ